MATVLIDPVHYKSLDDVLHVSCKEYIDSMECPGVGRDSVLIFVFATIRPGIGGHFRLASVAMKLAKIETPDDVTFRKLRRNDEPFLRRLYYSTRADEMAMVPWSETEKANFLSMQFEAQTKFYKESFTKADFLVIERQGEPIGRLYLDRREDEIRLIDIALLPQCRQQGLGGKLMRDVLAEGRTKDLPVRIHVEQNNPAMRLYERLGFEKIEDQGPYYLMEWKP